MCSAAVLVLVVAWRNYRQTRGGLSARHGKYSQAASTEQAQHPHSHVDEANAQWQESEQRERLDQGRAPVPQAIVALHASLQGRSGGVRRASAEEESSDVEV